MSQAFLDHIGIAVLAHSRLAELFALLGLPVKGEEHVAEEQVDIEWVPLPQKPARMELLQSDSPGSPIQKYLEKQGRDGIHHLSFCVGDLAAISRKIEAAGFRLVYPAPKAGAGHCLVNFVHPSSTGGILIELTQKN